MELLELLDAVLLGAVEGLTEFLPISSTGHLIIAQDLLGLNSERDKVFAIAIQLGAILAICWAYRSKIAQVVRGLPQDPSAQRFVGNLLIAFMPAAVLGLAFHHIIKEILFSPITVALALITGGLFILWVEHFYNRIHHIDRVEQMGWADALKVGVCQAAALFPGVSRSGATIMGGLLFGLSRQTATEFSFFLAIPTMFAATGYDVLKSWSLLQAADLPFFAVGFTAAFLFALLAVKGLLRYVAHHSFVLFAWYRIVFGALVLYYFW